jgi:hypothetical protein
MRVSSPRPITIPSTRAITSSRSRWAFAAAIASLACAGCEPTTLRGPDAATVDAPASDAPLESTDSSAALDAATESDAAAEVDASPGVDDAALVGTVFPRALGCTARTLAVVSVTNTGTTTWTSAAGYGVEAVTPTPLHTAPGRTTLADGETVAPGESHDFLVALEADGVAAHHATSWSLARDGLGRFGPRIDAELDVYCDTARVEDFDLGAVTIVSSPDVRGFAVTSRVSSLAFAPGTITIDHSLRGTWPPVVIADDGTTQEATIWVFFHIGGQWYATGGERLRPDQTTKALENPSVIGRDWLYDPGRWGVMTGYVPSPGDLVGFMVVAGSTRSDDHVIVRERTGVVLVPFPADGVATSYPPFAWEEPMP